MNQKKLKDLNLMDDFLFQAVMTYPDIGKLFAQRILELIFHRQFQNLTIVAQKVYGGMDTDLRGARLDLYVEENDCTKMDAAYDDSIYDLEPDRNNRVSMVKAFPKRARFYHATIDRHILKSGEEFDNLKNVYVIFLCNYDPFGYDRMQYTIKNMCVWKILICLMKMGHAPSFSIRREQKAMFQKNFVSFSVIWSILILRTLSRILSGNFRKWWIL